MPEGDTVWLTAHRLDQALGRQVLTRCELRVPQLATTDLLGMCVLEVVPRGKHLLTRLDSGLTLHSHLRMDGSWYLTRAGAEPRRYPEHRIRAQLGNVEWLASGYRVHDLRVVATSAEHELVGHLGPDLLGPDWDANEAVHRLLREPHRPIGETLLDQKHLAGIGNMYKCESLFLERIHPWRPTGAIPDLHRLVDTAQRLLRTNRDHPAQSTTGRTGRGQEHWVYRRGGESCLRCRTAIAYGEQGEPPRQRSTYWCPSCQPAEAGARAGSPPELVPELSARRSSFPSCQPAETGARAVGRAHLVPEFSADLSGNRGDLSTRPWCGWGVRQGSQHDL